MKLRTLVENYEQMFNGFPLDELNQYLPNIPDPNEMIEWSKAVLHDRVRIDWWLKWYRLTCLFALANVRKVKLMVAGEMKGGNTPEEQALIQQLEQRALNALTKFNSGRERAGLRPINPDFFSGIASGNSPKYFADIQSSLKHYADLGQFSLGRHAGVLSIKTYVFGFQTPNEINADLGAMEREWADKQKRFIARDDQDRHTRWYIFLDFRGPPGKIMPLEKSGWAWVMLTEANCRAEAKAMGHCANTRRDSFLLSLREISQQNGEWGFTPYLTFEMIKNGDGTYDLGEMKGRGNEKPAKRYHKYIIPLLLDPRVGKITGGGYAKERNFSLNDLTEEQRDEVIAEKPELYGPVDRFWNHDIRNQEEAENAFYDLFPQVQWDEIRYEHRSGGGTVRDSYTIYASKNHSNAESINDDLSNYKCPKTKAKLSIYGFALWEYENDEFYPDPNDPEMMVKTPEGAVYDKLVALLRGTTPDREVVSQILRELSLIDEDAHLWLMSGPLRDDGQLDLFEPGTPHPISMFSILQREGNPLAKQLQLAMSRSNNVKQALSDLVEYLVELEARADWGHAVVKKSGAIIQPQDDVWFQITDDEIFYMTDGMDDENGHWLPNDPFENSYNRMEKDDIERCVKEFWHLVDQTKTYDSNAIQEAAKRVAEVVNAARG